jgi:hypothetical protein
MAEEQDVNEQKLGMSSTIGPIEIDWPRTLGYYGGIGLALAFGLVEPPLAIFIAAIPLFKMLNRPDAAKPTRFVGQMLEGAARPVGGSAKATIQMKEKSKEPPRRTSILEEARQMVNQSKQQRLQAPGT